MSETCEADDDYECFHDSFDRLLSSSNTSCSCSPDASDTEEQSGLCSDHGPDDFNVVRSGPVPRFPVGLCQNYHIWASQPLSVEERRFHLLRQMGLSQDPSLSRHRPLRPVMLSPDHFNRVEKSPGFIDTSSKILDDNTSDNVTDDENSRLFGIVLSESDGNRSSYQNLEIPSYEIVTDSLANDCAGGVGLSVNDLSWSSDLDSPVGKPKSPRKPSKVNICHDANQSGNAGGSILVAKSSDLDISPDDDGGMCMIKNLDTGKEFVVNELREDGMWQKLQEVETGRQLTMEEFSSEMCVGTSPIVQELMRRQSAEDRKKEGLDLKVDGSCGPGAKVNRKRNWLRSIKNVASSVAGLKERRSSDERDTSSEKGGRRSSSATDDSQDVSFPGPERVRVRQYGKSVKELTALYKSQEIHAHNGSIWTMKASLEGRYLASAGEDCVVHVWQVVETDKKSASFFDKSEDGNPSPLLFGNGSPESSSMSLNLDGHSEKKRRGRSSVSRKSISLEQMLVPETVFALSEKPMCSFQGHSDDVLDLSWSKSQLLLSSSMDKTVRLWDLSSKCCLKIFSHSDYVTCIQFNPVDDRYFISGSLDAKVRIWSIPDRQVVDWSDLHEMVTAACYTPDGQGALVGSYKGNCRLYNTAENKLQMKAQINLQNKKKKSHQKKITGFQFAPGSKSEVLVTSADSRIRVVDGVDLVHKFKGFRNTHSQISASIASNGKYVISASEDSHVYIWGHEVESQPNRSKGVSVTQSYELFHCQDVSVAISWPVISDSYGIQDSCSQPQIDVVHHFDEILTGIQPTAPSEQVSGSENSPLSSSDRSNSPLNGTLSCAADSHFLHGVSRSWSEERLLSAAKNHSPRFRVYSNGFCQNRSALGMVIVTAGLGGEIRTFQNFGSPVRI